MYLENLVFDALDPRRLGRFWEAALDCETLTDEPDGFETRLHNPGGLDLDLGEHDVPSVVLGHTEDTPFCVTKGYGDTGPIAALALDFADPDRDGELWKWLTGWAPAPGVAPVSLRHTSGRGPLLELRPEAEPKGPGKNRPPRLPARGRRRPRSGCPRDRGPRRARARPRLGHAAVADVRRRLGQRVLHPAGPRLTTTARAAS